MKTTGWTKVPKQLHRNTSLSLSARILLIELLSQEINGRPSVVNKSELARNTGLHRVTVVKLLKEMVVSGFVTEEQTESGTVFRVTDLAQQDCSLRLQGGVASDYSTCSLRLQGVLPQTTVPVASDYSTCSLRLQSTPSAPADNGPKQVRKNIRKKKKKKETPRASRAALLKSEDKKPITLVRDTMVETWEQKFGTSYFFNGAKDGQAVKRLVAKFSPDEILARWKQYLGDTDAFTVKQGHGIAYFASRFNSYHPNHGINQTTGGWEDFE